MLAQRAADPHAPRRGRDHERGVGHVRAEAGLVGLEDVRADHPAVGLGDIGARAGGEPVRQRLVPGDLRVEDVGIAARDDRVEDAPDGVPVAPRGPTNGEHERMSLFD